MDSQFEVVTKVIGWQLEGSHQRQAKVATVLGLKSFEIVGDIPKNIGGFARANVA